MDQEVCRVEVVFTRRPGSGPVDPRDAVDWVMTLLENNQGQPMHSNSLRYSTPRVVKVTVV